MVALAPAAADRGRKRDYSLLGADAERAVETGLKAAEWYHTDVPRKEMKALMQRSDQPAIRDTILWLGSMAVFAGIAVALWLAGHPWLSVPFWLAYGVLYGSASDSRWHECGHGTAFKTPWMNDAVYQIASFMIMRNPATWRWSHTRHHTDTIIVGLDPEIAVMRPPVFARLVLNFFGHRRRLERPRPHALQRLGPHPPRGGDLHPRLRAAEGDPRRPHLDGDLRRDDRAGARHAVDPAADADRRPAPLRRLAPRDVRAAAARRPRRGRARPPAELAHRLHEPGLAASSTGT